MKIYNSLTNKLEEFVPIKSKTVNMYVCGPTVYGHLHIGNTRPIIFFDLVKNYLTFRGYNVYYVTNITDIDDKIIKRSIDEKIDEKTLAKTYENYFIDVLKSYGSLMPDLLPHATDFIPSMVKYIKELIDKDYAYVSSSGVYFRVNKVKDYGILSNQQKENLLNSVRIEVSEDKENPLDFAVWKFTKEGITFDAPFGKGRPGWHTECAVMNKYIFEDIVDIHGGGVDLKFPHHENEIAQSVATDHHHLAKYWMHVGRLDLDGEKMSKSLGNTIEARKLIIDYSPSAFRLLIFAHNYRAPIAFSYILMDQYQKIYDKISYTINRLQFIVDMENIQENQLDDIFIDRFISYLDDDFNTPNVVSLIEEAIKDLNKKLDQKLLNALLKVLEILGIKIKLNRATKADFKLYQDWIEARNNKDFQKADKLRKHFIEHGWM